jgi:hypothetical protein
MGLRELVSVAVGGRNGPALIGADVEDRVGTKRRKKLWKGRNKIY